MYDHPHGILIQVSYPISTLHYTTLAMLHADSIATVFGVPKKGIVNTTSLAKYKSIRDRTIISCSHDAPCEELCTIDKIVSWVSDALESILGHLF